ncbi:MAG TPA: hypothetical protein VJJ22_02550 [Candidatus Paceibacterota bacterium]
MNRKRRKTAGCVVPEHVQLQAENTKLQRRIRELKKEVREWEEASKAEQRSWLRAVYGGH